MVSVSPSNSRPRSRFGRPYPPGSMLARRPWQNFSKKGNQTHEYSMTSEKKKKKHYSSDPLLLLEHDIVRVFFVVYAMLTHVDSVYSISSYFCNFLHVSSTPPTRFKELSCQHQRAPPREVFISGDLGGKVQRLESFTGFKFKPSGVMME